VVVAKWRSDFVDVEKFCGGRRCRSGSGWCGVRIAVMDRAVNLMIVRRLSKKTGLILLFHSKGNINLAVFP
jgi:hypothetical protein